MYSNQEFLEPKLMGNRFDVNPFYMIMATFIEMELFGLLWDYSWAAGHCDDPGNSTPDL